MGSGGSILDIRIKLLQLSDVNVTRLAQAQDGSQLRLAFAEFNIADLALAPLAFFGKFFDIHFLFAALGANHSAKSKAFRVVDTAFHIFLQ